MKNSILLIRPAYSSTIYRLYTKLPRARGIQPPIGLMYIASFLEASGYPVQILDAEIELLDNKQILDRITKVMPAYVGITSTTPESQRVRELFDMIKRSMPEIVTVAGGPHFTAIPEVENETYDSIDYVVVGDGEKAFLKIINEKPIQKIIKVDNNKDLDKLPLPARHLIDYSHYRFPMPGKGLMRMDMIMTAKGCPFRCSFCFNRNTKVRYRDIKKCVDEIELSHRQYKTRFIMFLDDTLTISRERTIELCDEIIRRRLHKKVVFYANVRADTVDFKTLRKMRDAGVVEISMGVESGNQAILNNINKGTRLEQYERAYGWMRRLGLETRGSFIVGHPYETHETIRDTINFAKRIKLMRVSCCILTPYPGTEVYKKALKKEGIHLVSCNWQDFTRYGRSVIRTDALTKEDLEHYQRVFLMEFYTQPKVLVYHFLQFLKGNFSLYYYRPVIFAIKERTGLFLKRIINKANHIKDDTLLKKDSPNL